MARSITTVFVCYSVSITALLDLLLQYYGGALLTLAQLAVRTVSSVFTTDDPDLGKITKYETNKWMNYLAPKYRRQEELTSLSQAFWVPLGCV